MGIPNDTPLSTCLKVIFGLEHLKHRGAALQVALMPDFVIDVDTTSYAETMMKEKDGNNKGTPLGTGRFHIPLDETHRDRRAGGHATIAALALQRLHRPEDPLFRMTYVAKTGSVGRAYMEERLVSRLRGRGFPVDLTYCLGDGQDRFTFVRNIGGAGGVGEVRLYVQAIDRDLELKWDDLVQHPSRPLEQLAQADALGLFSPNAGIYREMLERFYDEKKAWLSRLPQHGQVVLLDMTRLDLTGAQGNAQWLDKEFRTAVGRLVKAGGVPVISLGLGDARKLAAALLDGAADPEDPPALKQIVNGLADRFKCPVVFHHSSYSYLVDPAGLLYADGERHEEFAPCVDVSEFRARPGAADCFDAGLLLALGVRRKLLRLAGVPACLTPTVRECLLMGELLAAGFLHRGSHPDLAELFGFASMAAPLDRSKIPRNVPQDDETTGIRDRDLPGPEELRETAASWRASPSVAGQDAADLDLARPDALAEWVASAQGAIEAGIASPAPPGDDDPLLNGLGGILAAMLRASPPPAAGAPAEPNGIPQQAVECIWQGIDRCADSDEGRLIFSALLLALSSDPRLFSPHPEGRQALMCPWRDEIREGGRPCVFVDLDGTVFDSRPTWNSAMANGLIVLDRLDPGNIKAADEAVAYMRVHIYENNPFFLAWERTRCNVRQIWCRREHLFAYLAFRAVQGEREDGEGLDKALKAACQALTRTPEGDGAAARKAVSDFLKTDEGRRFDEAYRGIEADGQQRALVDEAVAAFHRTPFVPYLDAHQLFFWLEEVAGLDVYVCTEGDEREQTKKLQRLGLFLDGPSGQVRTDRVLTTEAAANPEEPLVKIQRAVSERSEEKREWAIKEGSFAELRGELESCLLGAKQLNDTLMSFAEALTGREPPVDLNDAQTREMNRHFRELWYTPRASLDKLLTEQRLDAKMKKAKSRCEIEGLMHAGKVFERFRKKRTNPSFFARCIQAVQLDRAAPVRFLHKFSLPSGETQRSLRFVMIGDRYSSDCQPVHALRLKWDPADKRPVTTFRLLAGHYKGSAKEASTTPGEPTYSSYSLSEVLSVLLRKDTWRAMARIEEVSLLGKLRTADSDICGLALAKMVEDPPPVVETVIGLILEGFWIQDRQTMDRFHQNVANLIDRGKLRPILERLFDEGLPDPLLENITEMLHEINDATYRQPNDNE